MKTFTNIQEFVSWLADEKNIATKANDDKRMKWLLRSEEVVLNACRRTQGSLERVELYYLNQKIKQGDRILAKIPNLEALQALKAEAAQMKQDIANNKKGVVTTAHDVRDLSSVSAEEATKVIPEGKSGKGGKK
jgi:hypothetical protein